MAKVANKLSEYSKKEFQDASDTFYEVFEKWVLRSIESTFETTSNNPPSKGSPLAAYLLLSCAIDILAGFYSGRNPKISGSIGNQYKAFVGKYMKSYSPEILYKDLRCNMAHNFILGEGLGLTFNNSELHNTRNGDGRIIKNFDNLFSDLKRAFFQYHKDIQKDELLKDKFMKRFKKGGILALNLENISNTDNPSPVITNYRQKERL